MQKWVGTITLKSADKPPAPLRQWPPQDTSRDASAVFLVQLIA